MRYLPKTGLRIFAAISVALSLSVGAGLAQTVRQEDTYKTMMSDANFASMEGDSARTLALTDMAVMTAKEIYAPDDIRLAEAFRSAAFIYSAMRSFSKMNTNLHQMLDVTLAVYGSHSPDFANYLTDAAMLERSSQTPGDAEAHYLLSAEILFSGEGELQSEHMSAIAKTMHFFLSEGKYEPAERFFLMGEDLAAQYPDERGPQYINLLTNYGFLIGLQGRVEDGIAVLEQAVTIGEAVLGSGSPNLIPARVNLESLRKKL